MTSARLAGWLLAGSASLAISGCATPGSTVNEDKAAAGKSKAYLQSLSYVAAGGKLSESATCTLPTGLDKPVGKVLEGPSKEWKTLVAKANVCMNEKNWRNVEALGGAMARIDMDSPWGAYYLSLAAEAMGEHHRALWMVDQAQKKAGGKQALFSYQKGHILLRMGETVKGMAELQNAVAMDSRLTEAHLFLAEIHHRDLEWDKAASHYKAALEQEPKSYRALSGLAEVRLEKGSVDEAVALYKRAHDAAPKEIRPWLRLAFIHESVQKNNELALGAYRGLKSAIDTNGARERVDFDLTAKIKALEDSVKVERAPAQASTKPAPDTKRSVK